MESGSNGKFMTLSDLGQECNAEASTTMNNGFLDSAFSQMSQLTNAGGRAWGVQKTALKQPLGYKEEPNNGNTNDSNQCSQIENSTR